MDSPVLIVEPYADYRAEIAATLARQRYACDSVGSVADALLRVRDHDYRYLVLDIDETPRAEELLARFADQKVVLITEDATTADARYRILRKPFGRDELVKLLGS